MFFKKSENSETRLKVAAWRFLLAGAALLFVAQWTPSAESQESPAADAPAADAPAADAPAADAPAADAPAADAPAADAPAADAPAADATDEADAKADKPKRPEWDTTNAKELVEDFLIAVANGKTAAALDGGHAKMKETHTTDTLLAALTEDSLHDITGLEVDKGISMKDGYRLSGTATSKERGELPFYAVLKGPEDDFTNLSLYDIQSTESFFARIESGHATVLDWSAVLFSLALLVALLWIVMSYVKGLKGSPYELYLLFFTKVTEYSAYGAANMAFVLYLSNDMGMGDISAGTYIGAWSIGLTCLTMFVGAICDAIGIRATLLLGCYALLISRGLMPFIDDIVLVSLVGFVPLAFGIAVTGPVLSVGIKRYTTKAGASLGFGLFYTLMNVGWALGAYIFDWVRGVMGEDGVINVLGSDLSTYQAIIGLGFLLTLPDLVAILLMRKGVERTEDGVVIHPMKKAQGDSFVARFKESCVSGTQDTFTVMRSVFTQRAFWIFIGLIGVTVFVRLTFYHFHYTFPKYGIRLFGEGVKIGSIFGVLNPVMIIFLVPLIASLTQKVRSYWMLLVGTAISTASVFLVTIDPQHFAFLADTWFAEVVFDWWLEVPSPDRIPFYLSLVVFIIVFTIGEAIWSPRLMQFTAEIAPKGKEGSYVALSYLPYFGAKFIAGPMSGILVATYTPEGGIGGVAGNYPDHFMIWVWIGGMAILSPLGLALFRKAYRNAEIRAEEEEASEEVSS